MMLRLEVLVDQVQLSVGRFATFTWQRSTNARHVQLSGGRSG
jgi:hypothetical protein